MDKWDKRFMDMCELVATWTSCAREGRAVGAIITKNKRILTTGYNGAPSGIFNCRDKGECMRDKLGIPVTSFAMPCTRNRTQLYRRRNSAFPWTVPRFIARTSRARYARK